MEIDETLPDVSKRSSVESWLDGGTGAVGVEYDGEQFGELDMDLQSYGGGSFGGDDMSELDAYVQKAFADEVEDDVDVGVASSVADALSMVAQSEQRMAMATCRRKYIRGRAHVDHVYGHRDTVRQKLVLMERYIQLTSLEDESFYSMLRESRVVARVSGPTGFGKTTKLPALIATRCSMRVCLVTLDAHTAKIAADRMKRDYKVPGSALRWSREKKPYLSVMSYDDFVGVVKSNGRKRLFCDFDLFVYDEPQVPLAVLWLARRYFANFGQTHNSLIMLSATVSTNADNDMVPVTMGAFHEEPVQGGMSALIASGQLVGKYLVDRTMVIVADNRRVNSVREYYLDAGVDVRTLDTGSSLADVGSVFNWLSGGDTPVPRVLVAEQSYGTAYNFPVSYVITSATRLIYGMDGSGGLTEREVPLREAEVKQHRGRTDRGLTTGSGGVIASNTRASSTLELMECEELKAYLGLVAVDIEPKASLFPKVKALLPKGLNRDVAIMILSVELPPALVIRYLGSDGCVAKRFFKALSLFAQPDHVLTMSRDSDPVGYADWIAERMGGYYEGDESRVDCDAYVPFSSPESLKAIMHTLYAVSRRWIEVPYWHPDGDDCDSSDDEELGVRKVTAKVRPAKLRMPVDVAKPLPLEPAPAPGWSYDVERRALAVRKKRSAMSWLADRDSEGPVRALRDRAEGRGSFGSVTADVSREVDEHGVTLVKVKQGRGDAVDVQSPGGTVFLKLNESLYENLVNGVKLIPGKLLELVKTVSKCREAFVKSTLFDNYSNVWISVLTSLGDRESFRYVSDMGYQSAVVKIVTCMYDRYKAESVAVCASSNIYRKPFRSFIAGGSGVSIDKLRKYIKNGKMPIAQSDKFIARLMEIGEAHVMVLRVFEECGVFLPALVTRTQVGLPVRKKNGLMPVVGEDVVSISDKSSHWKWEKSKE